MEPFHDMLEDAIQSIISLSKLQINSFFSFFFFEKNTSKRIVDG